MSTFFKIQTPVVALLGHKGAPNTHFRIGNSTLMCLQESSPNLSVNSVEQRLLDLNRRSAAARGRLLELIEQQKQNASSVVSPPASPMPASALSPQSAGRMAHSGILDLHSRL